MLMPLVLKKSKKLMKIPKIDQENLYTFNDSMNFNGIFKKIATYDVTVNVSYKCHKKRGLHSLPRKYIFEKNKRGGEIDAAHTLVF